MPDQGGKGGEERGERVGIRPGADSPAGSAPAAAEPRTGSPKMGSDFKVHMWVLNGKSAR